MTITPDYFGRLHVSLGGGQSGVSSNFGIEPEKDFVVAVLTNASDVPSSELWLDAVNSVLDLPVDQKQRTNPIYGSVLRCFNATGD